nr:hypothetical protein [Tanacetum cinerariifolium]
MNLLGIASVASLVSGCQLKKLLERHIPPTYVDPDCYYEEPDAIKEVQNIKNIFTRKKALKLQFKALEMCDKARRRFQFYPYNKDIHYLIEQIRRDIEELEKKKKKNDVM